MTPPRPPDFLAVGHVAKDLLPEGLRLGGAVTYAAVTARRMGLAAAVVTRAGPDLDLRLAIEGTQVHVMPSAQTTTFRNVYKRGKRTQFLEALGGPIAATDIPPHFRAAPLVMLAPLAGEVSYDLAGAIPDAIVLGSIQGWLRQWDERGRIRPAYWDGADLLPSVDAAIVSTEDVGDLQLLDLWKELTPVLILTDGRHGARLHFKGAWHSIRPFRTREVDPTGAGDVFGAAYLIRFKETGDPLESACFASCAASFCVEAEGIASIPTRAQVEARLKSQAGLRRRQL